MKRLTGLGMTMVTVGLAGLTAMVAAQDGRLDANAKGGTARTCDVGTLRGTYGFTLSGLRPGVGGVPEQFVGVALVKFDGHGSFTQVDDTHGPSGMVTDRDGWGTYTVNPDCSGTSTLWTNGTPFPLEMRSVIVDDGTEVRTAVMAPAPIIVTSVGRKVF
jgi:hypothetical protein